MQRGWRKYQIDSATFFVKEGLNAKVEHKVDGARGSHVVDVFVDGMFHGLPFKWIVECKAWRSNIPKEKVMALASIVQDIGADRGILLSEVGFQSGAVRVAQKTNITLSSLADLAAATTETLQDTTIGSLFWRCQKAQSRLWAIKKAKYDNEYIPPMITPAAKCLALQHALERALEEGYPVEYLQNGENWETAGSLDELLAGAIAIIEEAENWEPPADR